MKKKNYDLFFFVICILPFQLFSQKTLNENTYPGSYNGRVGVAYFTNPNPKKILRGYSSFEFLMGFTFKEFWLDTFFSSSSGQFDAVASNSNRTNSLQSEGYFLRNKKEEFHLMQTGMGLTLESNIISRFLKSNKFYEYSTAFLTYSIFRDDMRDQEKYAGVGLRADYSLNYRLTSDTHTAFRLSYRFSSVARSPSDQISSKEARGERSLMLAWPSVGIETTYFF